MATNWARHHESAAIAVMRKESYRDYQNDIARSVPATLRLLCTSALACAPEPLRMDVPLRAA